MHQGEINSIAPPGLLTLMRWTAPARRVATGRLRLIVRLYFNPENAVPVQDARDWPDVG